MFVENIPMNFEPSRFDLPLVPPTIGLPPVGP